MKPNILIIVIDSLRADHVSCYGYERQTTPNIDRLAAEGCLFETCITAAPFSPASYASLFSNLYPHQHGVNGDTVRVWPNELPRLPELMRQYGYHTFCVSNNPFVSSATNAARGFDEFLDFRCSGWYSRQRERLSRRINRHLGPRTSSFLTSNRSQCSVKGDSDRTVQEAAFVIRKTRRPFFGVLILMDPHTPYRRPKHLPFSESGHSAVRRFFRTRNRRTMWAELMAKRSCLDDQDRAVVRDLYDAEVHHADACVGRMIDELSRIGRLDDTVVAVSSDHGEAFGEHGIWGHGFGLTDCLTRVPLIVRHPQYWPGNLRSQVLVQLHDLHELCLSIAHDGCPRANEYEHCLTQAEDAVWSGRDAAYSEFPRQSKTLAFMRRVEPAFEAGRWGRAMWSVRTPEWRYIEYEGGECELYSVRSDLQQIKSVADSNRELVSRLHRKLEAHRTSRNAMQRTRQTPMVVEQQVAQRLRELGYIT